MVVSAKIKSSFNQHETTVETNQSAKNIVIKPKDSGFGSSINGGELLLLSLATCFCNDIYREAEKRNIKVHDIEVLATCEFGAEGESGTNFQYTTNIVADATAEEIKSLIDHTDKIAEIHNTLRKGVEIKIHVNS